MSHFCVLVITESKPTREAIAAILQPWHEFECTGTDDKHVVELDETEEFLNEYNTSKKSVLRGPFNSVVCRYDDRFYRDPTPEETAKIGRIAGTGSGNGLSWTSKDWGDGLGYRTKVHYIPDGYAEDEVPMSEAMTLREFAEYQGKHIANGVSEIDPLGAHKYGFALFDGEKLVKVTRRTNPENKWDWWDIGGRWSGFLLQKTGVYSEKGRPGLMGSEARRGGADIIRARDVDFEGMRSEARIEAAEKWDTVRSIIGETISSHVTWDKVREMHNGNIDAARDFYNSQASVLALRDAAKANRDLVFLEPDQFIIPRAQYVDEAGNGAVSTFAFVRDGKWFERGVMGWWACVSNEMDRAEWGAQSSKMLNELPSESWLTVVDCHI